MAVAKLLYKKVILILHSKRIVMTRNPHHIRNSPVAERSACLLRRSVVSWLCATPWAAARQAPLSVGSLQARILEWVAMPSSRGSSQPRDQTQVSCTAGGFLTIWATREAYILTLFTMFSGLAQVTEFTFCFYKNGNSGCYYRNG